MEKHVSSPELDVQDKRKGLLAIGSYFLISNIGALFLAISVLIFVELFTDRNSMEFSESMLFNLLINIVVYIILSIVLIGIYNKELLEDIKKVFKSIESFATFTLFVGAGYVIYLFSIAVVTYIINIFIETGDSANQESLGDMMSSGPALMFLMVVVMAPIVEELVFRKAIFDTIKNPKIAFAVSSVLFAIIHFLSSLLIGDIGDLANIAPYIVMGIIFSSIYVYSNKNIIYPIGLHMANNFIAFIALLVMTYM